MWVSPADGNAITADAYEKSPIFALYLEVFGFLSFFLNTSIISVATRCFVVGLNSYTMKCRVW